MSQLLYLIIYDLPNTKPGNKRRTRLHEMLCGYGKWTQYSVFECFLTKMQFVKLQQQIENLIQPETDSVRIYVLDITAVKKAIAYGSQKPEYEDTIILQSEYFSVELERGRNPWKVRQNLRTLTIQYFQKSVFCIMRISFGDWKQILRGLPNKAVKGSDYNSFEWLSR